MSIYDELSKLENKAIIMPGKLKQEKTTQIITRMRESSINKSRGKIRNKPRGFPSRDEIQEFSFHLRDQLKVKVQAEVPHRWQGELEDLARELKVKKLELYRFILGEFLGKVRRKQLSG